MPLKQRVIEDMKAAMKAREASRLSAIRLLLAAIKQKEIDERVELGDVEVLSVVDKLIKQRRDSITQYRAAGRQHLADAENFELELLQTYLPAQLTDAEISAEVESTIGQTGASGARDMGKVMGLLKTKLSGRAEMGKVSALVKARLNA